MSPQFCPFFFFNDTASTEIYTLSLHDALPIYKTTYRLAHWPIWIWVFFLAPGPLTFQLFADRKSTRLNSSHTVTSYAVFCLKKKKNCQTYTSSECAVTRDKNGCQRT